VPKGSGQIHQDQEIKMIAISKQVARTYVTLGKKKESSEWPGPVKLSQP
jgi:hypothetical protein